MTNTTAEKHREVYDWYRYFKRMSGLNPKFIADNLKNIFKDTTIPAATLSSRCPENINPVEWDNMKEFYKRYLLEISART